MIEVAGGAEDLYHLSNAFPLRIKRMLTDTNL